MSVPKRPEAPLFDTPVDMFGRSSAEVETRLRSLPRDVEGSLFDLIDEEAGNSKPGDQADELAPPTIPSSPEFEVLLPRSEPKPIIYGAILTPDQEALLPKSEAIQPLPPAPIPDDPPPHEGAMIGLPLTVNSTDLLFVEVLEALPGRRITGKRLVRPDGTITLGFYGDVQVRGLTIPQIKTKVILHLRKFITDGVLGLCGVGPDGQTRILVAPEDSDRVFVDIAAYNSDVYYVDGWWAESPMRLPCTGSDTVLDALHYASGVATGADQTKVELIRPARGDQPKRVYKIDLGAILKGDPEANLQIFPNDRLYMAKKKEAKPEKDEADSGQSSSALRISDDLRALETSIRKIEATPAQKREVADGLIDLYVHATTAPGAEPLDEARTRADLKAILDVAAPGNDTEEESP